MGIPNFSAVVVTIICVAHPSLVMGADFPGKSDLARLRSISLPLRSPGNSLPPMKTPSALDLNGETDPLPRMELIFDLIRLGQVSEIRKLYFVASVGTNEKESKSKKLFVADSEFRNAHGWTPLYAAVYYGHQTMVDELLTKGEDINRPNVSELKVAPTSPRITGEFFVTGSKVISENTTSSTWQGGQIPTAEREAATVEATSPRKLDSPRREQLVLLSKASRDVASIRYNDGTPIFALARKPEIKPSDRATAGRLLAHDVDLRCTDAAGRTVIDLLEQRIARLNDVSVAMPKEKSPVYSAARDLYIHSLKPEKRPLHVAIQKDWVLLANSLTTAFIINEARLEEKRAKEASPSPRSHRHHAPKKATKRRRAKAVFPYAELIDWNLDLSLPPPHRALQTFRTIKRWLTKQQQFQMLLNYLIEHSEMAKNANMPERSLMFISEIERNDVNAVAQAIFEVDRDLFLAIDPRSIVIKCTQKEEDPPLAAYLTQMNRLPLVIERSVVTSMNPAKTFSFWKKVAMRLLALNDLYGAFCVRSGLSQLSIAHVMESLDLTDIPELQFPKVNTHEMNERADKPTIPSLIHEVGALERQIDAKLLDVKNPEDLIGKDSSTLQSMMHASIDHIRKKQELFLTQSRRQSLLEKKPTSLTLFFRHLPDVDHKATELYALNIAAKNQKSPPKVAIEELADTWDTRTLHQWLQSNKLLDTLDTNLNAGIVDGPSLLEKYAISKSDCLDELPNDVFAIFRYYRKECKRAKTKPFSEFAVPHAVNLYAQPDSFFEWITWLRNNQLSDAIGPLTSANIRSFKAFIDAYNLHGAKLFSNLAVDHNAVRKLTDLKKLRDRFNMGLPPLERWDFDDVRAWMLAHDLSHVVDAMVHDAINTADDFFALMYVYQEFKLKGCHYYRVTGSWVSRVFEAFSREVNMVKHLKRLPWPSALTAKDYESRLFFIRTFLYLEKPKVLGQFLEENILTLKNLKESLQIDLYMTGAPQTESVLAAGTREPLLLRYGFNNQQVETLEALLSQQTL